MKAKNIYGVYLGIDGYGTPEAADKNNLRHLFFTCGKTVCYTIAPSEKYMVQNVLQEGYIFQLQICNEIIEAAFPLSEEKSAEITYCGNCEIQIDGKQIYTTFMTKAYDILFCPGKAEVKEIGMTALRAGDKVMLFFNNDLKGDMEKNIENSEVVSEIYRVNISDKYLPPVTGRRGIKTLKNFLVTAMEAVGAVLYVYGGAWNWQDSGMGRLAGHIGLSESWLEFFSSQNKDYDYKNTDDFTKSYYPHNGYNEYYYAGVDCSAYVSWVVYNVINIRSYNKNESEKMIVGTNSTEMARSFAITQNWGSWSQKDPSVNSAFKCGDIFSTNGHVWISLGTCKDESIVILHSTPSPSVSGSKGGGPQLSALDPKSRGKNCEAYRLANYYMSTFYPQWSKRYKAIVCDFKEYTAIKQETSAGKFTWDLSGDSLLTDPEGYELMGAEEILADVFSHHRQGI